MNLETIKDDFPILNRTKDGKPFAYLDNAATTQKPLQVINAISEYYKTYNANIHRSFYDIAEKATAAYENARETIQKYINAKSEKEIIFTKNTTEAINLIAYSWGEKNIQEGDEIVVSILEHHSNFVPWQQLCLRKNAILKIIPLNNDRTLDLDQFEKILSNKTKLVAITGMSNVLGVCPDLIKISKLMKQTKARLLIDGAQYAAHNKPDVQTLDCDFFTMSAHKMLGPTGIGALYAKREILETMPPFLYGGDMVKIVSENSTTFNDLPWKFEAGTQNVAGAIGFAEGIKYLESAGLPQIARHDRNLINYAIRKFSAYSKVKILLPKANTTSPATPGSLPSTPVSDLTTSAPGSILPFTITGIHPHDIAEIFNQENVAIRAGLHCAEPLAKALNVPATARLSVYLYNTRSDIDQAEIALKKVLKLFE